MKAGGFGWSRLAALVVVSALSLVLTAEVALRLMAPRSQLFRRVLQRSGEAPEYTKIAEVRELLASTPFAPTPLVAWGGFKLNGLGLRTHEYDLAKPSGTCRIVVLGDSFAFDSGFAPWDEIWHHRVGRSEEKRLGRRVEVINLGVPAVGPRFYLRMLELEGERLTPDLVVVSLFVGNDLIDEAGARGSFLQRWSYSWRLVSLLVRHPRALLAESARPSDGPGGRPISGYSYDPRVPLNDRTTFLRIARETADGLAAASRGEMDREIADVVDVMEKIARRVRPLGARLLVVLIPDRVELDADLRREAAAEAASDADFDRLHQTLVARLAARGVPTIDLLGALRAAPTEPPLYRRFDTHWSAAGNRFAAELIAAELARETWCRNG